MAPNVNPPPAVIASWPKPNYVNPETRGPALLITCITLSVIGVIVVAARIYARFFITKAPGLDDAIIVVALLLAIGSSILAIYGSEVLYVGYHVWDVPVGAISAMQLNDWCSQWFYVGALCAVKVSLLLFYRRLSTTFSRLFLWATWIGIGYNCLGFLTYALIRILQCRPTSAYWLSGDPTWIAEGHTYTCADISGVILPLYSSLSVIGDFYSTTLPLLLVYSLQMSHQQKMSLYLLFALGYLVVGAGIFKTVYINELLNETYDESWVYYESLIWITIELYFAIYCASAPGLKPYVKKFFVETTPQNTTSLNYGSGYTFGTSGENRSYTEKPTNRHFNNTRNDEESWTRDQQAEELSEIDDEDKSKKTRVMVHKIGGFLNDRARHSLIPNETRSGLAQHPTTQQSPKVQYEQYQREQLDPSNQYEHQRPLTRSQSTTHNATDRNRQNSEESILAAPVILDYRASYPGQVVPFIMREPLPEPWAEASIEVSESGGETDSRDSEFELPLQGTRENSPTDMRSKAHRMV